MTGERERERESRENDEGGFTFDCCSEASSREVH